MLAASQAPSLGALALSALVTVTTIVALPILALLGLESRALGAAVGRTVDREGFPGAFEFEHVVFGPGLFDATVYGAVLRGREGLEILTAERIFVSLEAPPEFEKDVKTRLVVKRFEADDFDLRLEWNRFGDLLLTDVFANRRFGLRDKVSPEPEVLIDLQDIVLRRGRLVLGWPAFGFHFDGIDGQGAVRIDGKGLHIKVPRLGSDAGSTWLASASDAARAALATLPQNERSSALREQGAAPIPFESVTFTDFVWEGTRFDTRLEIAGTTSLEVSAFMDFPKDEPIVYGYDAAVRGPAALFEALTGGRIAGFTGTRVAVKGAGPAAVAELGPVALERLTMGRVEAGELSVPSLHVDLTGPAAAFRVALDAAKLRVGAGSMEGVHAEVAGSFGWAGFTPKAFLRPLLSPPSGTVGWLTAWPAVARLDLTVPSGKVGSWTRTASDGAPSGSKVEAFDIRALKLGGTLGRLDLEVGGLEARGHGAAVIKGKLETSLGFSGLSLDADVSATLAAVPRDTLAALLPKGLLPSAAPPVVSGNLRLTGDPRDAKSLALESPWATPPAPEAPGAGP